LFANGVTCTANNQCASTVCAGDCCATACATGVCGATSCNSTGACVYAASGTACNGGGTCNGAGSCNLNQCQDGIRDGAETDIDCGGGTCAPCAIGKGCFVGKDCTSGICTANVCSAVGGGI
jgi:hypothetical protein